MFYVHPPPPSNAKLWGIAFTASDTFVAKRLWRDVLLFQLHSTLDSDYSVEMSEHAIVTPGYNKITFYSIYKYNTNKEVISLCVRGHWPVSSHVIM